MTFERFIAVDWSGARGPALHSLQVAFCEQGQQAPVLISNPKLTRNHWRRNDLLEWISEKLNEGVRTLVGMDFAFAYPFCDRGTYFPEDMNAPVDHTELWSKVEEICAQANGLYGGPFYLKSNATYASYIRYQTYTGEGFEERFRQTERACRDIYGTQPACDFVCVGPNSVGIGSIAGMRLLNRLHKQNRHALKIWPFEPIRDDFHALVEIFPRLFYVKAMRSPNCWHDTNTLNEVLTYYHSMPISASATVDTEDKADAIVSAAALRSFANDAGWWATQRIDDCAAKYEGWIFGV